MNNDTSSLKENMATGNAAATDSVAAAPGLMDSGTARNNAAESVAPAYGTSDTDPVLSADSAEGAVRAAEANAVQADVEPGLPPVATGVSDDMSFSQAFAVARAEVGAGGAFEWHGQIYGTYYKNEWDGMDAQERLDFEAAAIRSCRSESSADVNAIHDDDQVVPDTTDKYTHDSPDGDVQHDMVQVDTVDDDEVHILGLESVQDEDGNQLNIASIDINGEHAVLVDIDNDQVMDVLVHDDNGDGQISEDEIQDVTEHNITISEIQDSMQGQNGEVTAGEYASNNVAQAADYDQDFSNNDMDMSDFDNNADVSDFV